MIKVRVKYYEALVLIPQDITDTTKGIYNVLVLGTDTAKTTKEVVKKSLIPDGGSAKDVLIIYVKRITSDVEMSEEDTISEAIIHHRYREGINYSFTVTADDGVVADEKDDTVNANA